MFGASGLDEARIETNGAAVNMLILNGYTEVYDNMGNLVFLVRYHAGRREFGIRLARDPHMTIYVKNSNREMRMMLQRPNALARYEWVATAGLLGFNTPRPALDTALTDIEKRRRRASDLIDRTKWNAFVKTCLDRQAGVRCDTEPLTRISAPLVFYNNQPVGPADSSFRGWSPIEAYGITNVRCSTFLSLSPFLSMSVLCLPSFASSYLSL